MKHTTSKIIVSLLIIVALIGGGWWVWYTSFVPIWEKKVDTQQVLKIGVITDIQLHPIRKDRADRSDTAERILKEKHVKLLDNFVAEMERFQPDVIVLPGDIVEGTNDPDNVSMAGMRLVQEHLAPLGVPMLWAVGNHELRSMTKDQYKESLGIDYLDGSFDFGDYRIVVVDSNFHPDNTDVSPEDGHIRGHVAPASLAQLAEALATDKHTIVTMHHPPLAGDHIQGEGRKKQILDNTGEVRAILGERNARMAFGGHLEVKHHEVADDVEYFALTGTKKSATFPESYYAMTITNDAIDVTMFYTDSETGEQQVGNFHDITVEYWD